MRAEQIATLTALLAHRKIASDELGRLLDAAAASLNGAPYDSLRGQPRPRRPARLGEGAQVPSELRAEIARETSVAEHAWESAREESDFAVVPPLPRARGRAQAPLRRVLRVRAPLRPAARRLRAGDADRRAAPGARAPPRRRRAAARGDRRQRHRARRRRRSTGTFPPRRSGALAERGRGERCPWSPRRGASTRPCTRSRSGSRSPTCGSPPASTPTTSAPRCGRSCTRPATRSTRTGSARSSSARRCAARSRSASTSLRAGSGRTGSAGVGRSCPACCRCLRSALRRAVREPWRRTSSTGRRTWWRRR